MHGRLRKWLETHKDKCTKGKRILDVGALHVNGSVRQVLPVSVGVDMREGKGVDVVCKGENLPDKFPEKVFDVVISTDTLEHVENWRGFLRGMWYVLKDDGWFIISIASKKKGRHAYPDDYWRLDEDRVKEIFPNYEDYTVMGVSVGWIVKKRKDEELPDLDKIHLDPVDKKVPKHLLEQEEE